MSRIGATACGLVAASACGFSGVGTGGGSSAGDASVPDAIGPGADGASDGATSVDAAPSGPFCPRAGADFCADFDDPTKPAPLFGFATEVLDPIGTMALTTTPAMAGNALHVTFAPSPAGPQPSDHAHLNQTFSRVAPVRVEADVYIAPASPPQQDRNFAVMGVAYAQFSPNYPYVDVYIDRGTNDDDASVFVYGGRRDGNDFMHVASGSVPLRKWVHFTLEATATTTRLTTSSGIDLTTNEALPAAALTPATTTLKLGMQRYRTTQRLEVTYDNVTVTLQ
jgi:hypothetical protein